MDCFDPFKDYLELAILETDLMEEESPVPEVNQGTSTDVGWLNNGYWSDLNCRVDSGHWTPGSSSGESTGARPILGRRSSADDVPSQQTGLEHHTSSSQAIGKRLNSGAGTALLSDMASAMWVQDCGAWTDMIDEVNGGHTKKGKMVEWGQDWGAWTDMCSEMNGAKTTRCSRNPQTVTSNNGLYCSTGFFGGSDASQDSSNIATFRSKAPGESLNPSTSYPHYSNAYNIEYPDAVAALLLKRLMKQADASVAEKNRFRNFSSLDAGKFCAFCKKNREPRDFYTTHVVKDSWGKVICPILRKYVCPNCKATGDQAHTLGHCPFSTTAEHSFRQSRN